MWKDLPKKKHWRITKIYLNVWSDIWNDIVLITIDVKKGFIIGSKIYKGKLVVITTDIIN